MTLTSLAYFFTGLLISAAAGHVELNGISCAIIASALIIKSGLDSR